MAAYPPRVSEAIVDRFTEQSGRFETSKLRESSLSFHCNTVFSNTNNPITIFNFKFYRLH